MASMVRENSSMYTFEWIKKHSLKMSRIKFKLPSKSQERINVLKRKLNIVQKKHKFDRISFQDKKAIIEKQKEELCELYKTFNKITDKTYEKLSTKIIEVIQKIEEIELQEEICEKIFTIISTNSFFSEMYAKLYQNMININPSFQFVFNRRFEKFIDTFSEIKYISADEDYDGYCLYIKQIEKIKSLTTFFSYCLQVNVCTEQQIIDLIMMLQKRFMDQIEISFKINENEAYVNSIFCLMQNNIKQLQFHDQWQSINENINKMQSTNGSGKSNKIRFKIMDISDLIKKQSK